jgi:hypothetical protein
MSLHSRPKEGLSSPSRQEIVNKSTKGSCRHQVDRKGIIVTKSTQKELSSPSRQEVVTQSTKGGVAVTKSTQRGCRHPADKRSLHSQPHEWGHQVNPRSGNTKSTQGTGTPSQPRSGDTKSTQGAGTPSQPRERGHQVNPRSGDTKSTHREREGTPS